ncbi:MAG: hypothetical protein LBL06_05545 [Treponema sp.]|jgi:hypothetical protein|nr:hypothetical protein [Treponema sp.]
MGVCEDRWAYYGYEEEDRVAKERSKTEGFTVGKNCQFYKWGIRIGVGIKPRSAEEREAEYRRIVPKGVLYEKIIEGSAALFPDAPYSFYDYKNGGVQGFESMRTYEEDVEEMLQHSGELGTEALAALERLGERLAARRGEFKAWFTAQAGRSD